MMKIYLKLISVSLLVLIITACEKSGSNGGTNQPPPPPPTTTEFAKGADISWLTQMEVSNKKFYNSSGVEQDCILILKNLGMNTVRLRVWVNPASGWNSKADVIAKVIRAKNLGMRIMIDFHYSDMWADPGHQEKPAAWTAQDFATLKTSLYNHTVDVLTALKNIGITPEWVQVGNETNDGMLWLDGKASTSMINFTQLVNAGYDAVKATSSTSKVIVHISNGYDNNLFRWIFDGLKNNGGKWDVIGLSLYPNSTNWSTLNSQAFTNMNDMVARYGKEVMVVEVGMSWDNPVVAKSFLTDLISKTKLVTGNKGLGVLYWEPEAYGNWEGYTLGAFDNSGKPTEALDAFK